MNSPMYIGVVIRPDDPPETKVICVAHSETLAEVEGVALREYAKAQQEWEARINKEEPPMWDTYICMRRDRIH